MSRPEVDFQNNILSTYTLLSKFEVQQALWLEHAIFCKFKIGVSLWVEEFSHGLYSGAKDNLQCKLTTVFKL